MSVDVDEDMRTVFWDYEKNRLNLIDQRRLPTALELFTCINFQDVEFAIKNMVVRGAPAIGASAAFGLALAAQRSNATDPNGLISDLEAAKVILQNSRPTAINLTWGLNRVMAATKKFDGSLSELQKFCYY